MKLEEEQIALLQSLWANSMGKDALQKLVLTAIAEQGIPVSVRDASAIFDGMDAVLKPKEERAKDANRNI